MLLDRFSSKKRKVKQAAILLRSTASLFISNDVIAVFARLKHKKELLIMTGLISVSYLVMLNPPSEGYTPYDGYSLSTQIIVGALFAVYFWYLHLRENDKIQEIGDRKKHFWGNRVQSMLYAIKNSHAMLKGEYEKLLNTGITKAAQSELEIFLNEQHTNVSKHYIPKLDAAINQVADLLREPSIFDSITGDEYVQFTQYLTKELGYFEDSEQIKHMIEVLEARVKTIDTYMKRIAAETPEYNPPKMKTVTEEDWS